MFIDPPSEAERNLRFFYVQTALHELRPRSCVRSYVRSESSARLTGSCGTRICTCGSHALSSRLGAGLEVPT
jgi:hypothetical protein